MSSLWDDQEGGRLEGTNKSFDILLWDWANVTLFLYFFMNNSRKFPSNLLMESLLGGTWVMRVWGKLMMKQKHRPAMMCGYFCKSPASCSLPHIWMVRRKYFKPSVLRDRHELHARQDHVQSKYACCCACCWYNLVSAAILYRWKCCSPRCMLFLTLLATVTCSGGFACMPRQMAQTEWALMFVPQEKFWL